MPDNSKPSGKRIIRMLLIVTAAITVCVLVIFGLGTYSKNTGKTLNVVYIPKSSVSSNDFWDAVKKGALTSAKENSVSLTVRAPEDETKVEEQKSLIRAAITEKPDAMVVAPASTTECSDVLKEVKSAGIPLVFVDSLTDDTIADACVATDNVAAGTKMGELINETITDDDQIGIISHVKNSSTAKMRESGFRESLGSRASQIVGTVYSNSSTETARRVTEELIEQYPGIDYLVCMNEDSSVGAARAVNELGLSGQIVIEGFDNATEEIQNLESGTIKALVIQKAFTMGYLSIENAARLARGESVDYQTDSGSALITKENMYETQNQELLFPFYGTDFSTGISNAESVTNSVANSTVGS